jgi:hypothetical protein
LRRFSKGVNAKRGSAWTKIEAWLSVESEEGLMKQRFLLLFLVATLNCYGIEAARAQDSSLKDARMVAEAWMPLWDDGKWEESYKELAEYSRKETTPGEWFTYWRGVRKPLGKVRYRKLVESKYIESLRGLPGRAGVVFRYESSFENKEVLLEETFALIHEKDGTWRVAYYFTSQE